MRLHSSASIAGRPSSASISPLTRIIGGLPMTRWTSLAPFATALLSTSTSSAIAPPCRSVPLDLMRVVEQLVQGVEFPGLRMHEVHDQAAVVEHAPQVAAAAVPVLGIYP